MTRRLAASILALGLLSSSLPAADSAAGVEFFEARVRPVLAEHCWSCHGPGKQQAGLRLDSRASMLKGSDNGPVVTPGDPAASKLLRAVRREGELKMPPRGPLPPEAVAALTEWVKLGLPWPASSAVKSGPPAADEARAQHWAFRPVRQPPLPAVKDPSWAKSPIDLFVLARLEEKGLAPAAAADRRALLRRVTLDLTGLPPTPEEVDAFLADPSPDAFARVVDRLLASPRYGETWGRHWLDVARYADTKGYVFNEERRYPHAYTYRDYVIGAFNDDLPYDQFLLHQLAADRLDLAGDSRPLAAMGFLTLGRRFLNSQPDIIDDRLDVTFRGLQGLTVGCARCHDHKSDPIPMKDYYSLYGVFASSVEPKDRPTVATPEQTKAYQEYSKRLAELEGAVKAYEEKYKAELEARNRKHRDELRQLRNKVDTLKVTHPGSPPQAMVLVDAPSPVQPVVFKRGNPNNRGDSVPRQFLEVLTPAPRRPFAQGSGRLELARAIASRDNPLTARVLVNRAWMHHFGAGLVRTPGDFGIRGEPPTHPELLDYLAARFMADGWSVKSLHRVLLLSATYQQSSTASPQALATDPDNRWLSHANRRRLALEPLRDSLLWAAGRLDPRMGGPGAELTSAPFSTRRTVYGFIERQNLPGLYRTFDLASPDSSTPQRHMTTVPQQALFLLNSPFVVEQAKALAARSELASLADDARVDWLYRRLYGRAPDAEERQLGRAFVASSVHPDGTQEGPAGLLSPWERYAQVLLLANEFVFTD